MNFHIYQRDNDDLQDQILNRGKRIAAMFKLPHMKLRFGQTSWPLMLRYLNCLIHPLPKLFFSPVELVWL